MKQLFLILALVSVISGQSISMNDATWRFFQEFRCRMFQDMDDLGFPILEPLEVDEFEIELDEEMGTGKALLRDAVVTGLSTFELTDLNFNLMTLDFFLDIVVPKMTATGYYEIEGEIVDVIDLVGSGDFDLELENIHIYIDGRTFHDGFTLDWSLPRLEVDFTLGKMSGNIAGIMNDEVLEEFFNHVINSIGAELVNVIFPDLEPEIVKVAQDMTNETLSGTSLREVIDIIYLEVDFLPELEAGRECEYEWPRPDSSKA